MKKKRALQIVLCIFVVLMMLVGCTTNNNAKPEKDKIVIGGVRSQSGPLAIFDQIAFGPVYRMWVEEINAAGGLYVKEYDKKLPIELLIYDDTSDVGTMTRLLEKLIVEDKVDFILPPVSTASLFAAAPIANEHGYILMGAEGGSKSLNASLASMDYFYSILNHAEHQVPVLIDVLKEAGVKKCAIIFIGSLHGIEYSGEAIPNLEMNGIEVVFAKSVPPGISDLSPIINEAKEEDVDAFLAFVYPDEGFLALRQSMELGFFPDVFMLGPGANFEFFRGIFGEATEGVMGWGAWNEKSSPAAKAFVEKFLAAGNKRENLDWWGHLPYYASLQILQQAIEKTGTLDQAVLTKYIRENEFETVLGKTWFENGNLAVENYPGQLGQWQNGIFEVIGPKNRATAKPLIPRTFGR